MTKTIKYSVVIPCYCSGEWLADLVDRIRDVLFAYGNYEIILVNDRSPDTVTWPQIENIVSKHPHVKGVDLLFNVGQFRATLCGLEQAVGEYVITMDDDLQHPPEEIPKLIEAMQNHSNMDCIMGRYQIKQHTAFRNWGSRQVMRIMNILYGKPSDVVTTSFRIMPSQFVNMLLQYRIANPQMGPLIVSVTRRIMNVPVAHEVRKKGSTGYRPIRMGSEVLRSIINASVLPLRFFSVMGFIVSCAAFALGLFYFFRWLLGGVGVAGFTTLILAISIFSGVIIAGIGILGEYVGRIINEVTGMPRYCIRQIVGASRDE